VQLSNRVDKKRIDREVAALNILGQKHHPHLVRLLASYNFKGSQHLIFPWADGNLREFWEQHQKPAKPDAGIVRWAAHQMLGLASALEELHDHSFVEGGHLYGRHGDLKPENILMYKGWEDDSEGILVIADLGLSSFHRTYQGQRRDKRCTPTYRPPEFDLSNRWSSIYDIWSLGCIFLEFATWLLLDWNAVEHAFPAARTTTMMANPTGNISKDDSFFTVEKDTTLGKDRVQVKESVIQVKMHSHLPISLLLV